MEKKTPMSKNTFGSSGDGGLGRRVSNRQKTGEKKMQTHLSKILRLLGYLVPCVEVFYVMDKSAAAQCSINIDTYLFHC